MLRNKLTTRPKQVTKLLGGFKVKIQYIKKYDRRILENNKNFTTGKIYEVLADYRNRTSAQKINDSGLVIQDDFGVNRMIFENEFLIVDTNKENTYVYEKPKGEC